MLDEQQLKSLLNEQLAKVIELYRAGKYLKPELDRLVELWDENQKNLS